jgi:threonine dehydrogenase-like Zn-dependent dehydrogenase
VADRNLIPIPVNASTTNTALELDYLLVSDVWPTSWQVLDWAGFQPADSVAVWGLGSVGLLAVYSAKLRGASNIYAIDHVQTRLDAAEAIGGVIPINFATTDPAQTLLNYEPEGVMRLIDCIVFEALNATLDLENTEYIQRLVNTTRLKGGIGLGGVWTARSSAQRTQGDR